MAELQRSWPSSRRETQTRLEDWIEANRFTIAVVFPLVGAVVMVASAEGLLPGWLAFQPILLFFGTLVMRSPLLVAVTPLIDRRGGVWLLGLLAFTYLIEFVGVQTGVPYGEFSYGVRLGPMLGEIPVGLPLFYIPLVLNAVLLVVVLTRHPAVRCSPAVRIPAALAVVLAIDLVLDPAAVALGFWQYAEGGAYYGVPWRNFLGWIGSGVIAVGFVEATFDADALRERLEDCAFALDDLVSFLVLWASINAVYGNWLALAVAGVLGGVLGLSQRPNSHDR